MIREFFVDVIGGFLILVLLYLVIGLASAA